MSGISAGLRYPSGATDVPRQLFGHHVLSRIGQGAGSVIYTVRHANDGRVYALKHVVRTADKDIRFVDQLHAEHEASRHAQHPGLRRTLQLMTSRSLLYRVTEAGLLMEHFDGRTLESVRPSSILAQLTVFIRTARALEALHAMGFVHCDLKPANILLARGGAVKVIDLGQAARPGTAKPRIQGTPDYISPEQVCCEPVTVQTDVFNFGATMYWTLCGQTLPTLYTVKQGANSFLLDARIDPPHLLNRSVPETLSNLVMQCARTKPSKRPADMKELLVRLQAIRQALRRTTRGADRAQRFAAVA